MTDGDIWKWILAALREGWKCAVNICKENIESGVNVTGIGRTAYSSERDMVKVMRVARLRWLGHVFGVDGTRVWSARTGPLQTAYRS